MIKAIETVYNGYRFRSRLEARWAVFFDALGVKYEYEKEGFDLGGELKNHPLRYFLPDFYLPNQNAWVEIKPLLSTTDSNGATLYTGAILQCAALSHLLKSYIILIAGNPWPREYYMVINHEKVSPEWGIRWQFAVGRRNHNELWIVTGSDIEYAICFNPITSDDRLPLVGNDYEPLRSAYQSARQARFEHGETPFTD